MGSSKKRINSDRLRKTNGLIMNTLAQGISILVLFIVSPIINGWVLSKIWLWFIVHSFNAPVISIPEAIGLMILIGFFKGKEVDDEYETKSLWEKIAYLFIRVVVKSGFLLLFALIIKQFL